jgi:hypothetical protein
VQYHPVGLFDANHLLRYPTKRVPNFGRLALKVILCVKNVKST